MAKITYEDKIATQSSLKGRENLVTAADLNEILVHHYNNKHYE